MQHFSLVYNNLFVFLEPVDEPQPTYACGHFMQGSLQAPERQIGYCTPMKTVAYNKFNNNTWFQSVVGHSC